MGMELSKTRLSLLTKKKLYIHNLKLRSQPELEHRFTKFLQDLQMKDMGLDTKIEQ